MPNKFQKPTVKFSDHVQCSVVTTNCLTFRNRVSRQLLKYAIGTDNKGFLACNKLFKLIFRPTVDAKWCKWINVNQQSRTMEVQRQLELDTVGKRHLEQQ